MEKRIKDIEGNISTIQKTLNSLITTIEDVEGNVSSVTQLATGLQARVSELKTELGKK